MDAANEMQRAIVGRLKAKLVAGGRVYDRPPQSVTFPYVHVGEVQVIDDEAEGVEAFEVFATLHTWSQNASFGGKPEAMAIQAAMRAALHSADLALVGGSLIEIRHRDSRAFIEGDGITVHGVCTYRALVEAH